MVYWPDSYHSYLPIEDFKRSITPSHLRSRCKLWTALFRFRSMGAGLNDGQNLITLTTTCFVHISRFDYSKGVCFWYFMISIKLLYWHWLFEQSVRNISFQSMESTKHIIRWCDRSLAFVISDSCTENKSCVFIKDKGIIKLIESFSRWHTLQFIMEIHLVSI